MNIQRINWKLFITKPEAVNHDEVFRIFAGWIENSPEVFVDVADYAHVHDGPVTVLIGYACDYWLDQTGKRLGLVYNQRQNLEGDNTAKLRSSLKALKEKAAQLKKEMPGVEFEKDQIQFLINDRLVAPNQPASLAAVEKELKNLFGDKATVEKSSQNDKERLSVLVKFKSGSSWSDF